MCPSINVSERLPGFTDSLRPSSQFAGEEMEISRTGIGGIFGAVAGLVVRVLEGVAGIRVDLHVDGLADLLHLGGEGVDAVRRDALVQASVVAQDGCVDLSQGRG